MSLFVIDKNLSRSHFWSGLCVDEVRVSWSRLAFRHPDWGKCHGSADSPFLPVRLRMWKNGEPERLR